MSTSILLLLIGLVAGSYAHFGRGSATWSESKPTSCPNEDQETHVCSSLNSLNLTCATVKCCSSFDEKENAEDYDPDSIEDDYEVFYLVNYPGVCRLCVAFRNCTVYSCSRRCCDGYERDYMGRCQNKTGGIECKNGGVAGRDYYSGSWFCSCPPEFVGPSCEISACHCQNGGECKTVYGRLQCECNSGYKGEFCEIPSCMTVCQNGGSCISDGRTEVCMCPQNFVGKYCETRHTNSELCPPPPPPEMACNRTEYECKVDSDCPENGICCNEHSSMICRRPKSETCMHSGRTFAYGEEYRPNACETCRCTSDGQMLCNSVTCDMPTCPRGQTPSTKPGTCCPSCPDTDGVSPRFENCPVNPLVIDTQPDSAKALLNIRSTRITAVDSSGTSLKVKYKSKYVRHCKCDRPDRRTTVAVAYAKDAHGRKAYCEFQVIVRDTYPPVIKKCPDDIFVFEDEKVQWEDPVFYDNVGIAHKGYRNDLRTSTFDVGIHPVAFYVLDFDDNRAMCSFNVSVSRNSERFENLPEGLRERSTGDKQQLAVILGPVVGGIALLVIAVVVIVLCCCRNRRTPRQPRSSHAGSQVNSEHIYAVPGDIQVKLPAYKDIIANPPPYSINGDMKDGEYAHLSPPSYKESNQGSVMSGSYINPGYETLNVQSSRMSVSSNK